jgi:8-oxo-dGTP pyrophosphatase MutT (NUDIX family)
MNKPLLDFDPSQEPVTPKDAATIVVARDAPGGPEIFCVERNKKSRFMGGAIVFPGGKLDDSDRSDEWITLSTPPPRMRDELAPDLPTLRALSVAALRETLEEAALLIADGPVSDGEVLALRAKTEPGALAAFLRERRLRLDAASLHPLARWITPTAETRRYDARFFLAVAPQGQTGAHDMQETMSSLWTRPSDVLARFDRREVQLAPPTHRTLQLLSHATGVAEMLSIADQACLLPICPELKMGDGVLMLTLPGDPQHQVPEKRIAGGTRYVLRDEHWQSE